MPKITVYSKAYCPYCQAAKALLTRKGATFEEIDVTYDPEGQRAMARRAGGRSTVPQIFIGETHVGGYAELAGLERAGRLDALLGS